MVALRLCLVRHDYNSVDFCEKSINHTTLFRILHVRYNNDLVEILDENIPIDIVKYINHVKAPQAGAISTFSGTTRDTFDGKTVLELRYEAYVPMAVRCLKTICLAARSSWILHSIAIAHRLGSVPVGETSVFIAVSSVHRAFFF
ncbi:hypothetical protein ACFE04_027191 [Oxalis oulophora]